MTRIKLFGLALAFAALYANAETVPARQAKDHTISVHGATDQPYALVRPGERGTQGSGNSADWKAIAAAKKAIPGDFLWFRHDGKAYVVRDAALLSKVIDAWAPVQRLGDDMDVYGREMEQHGKAMEALGRKMERAGREGDVASRKEQIRQVHAPMEDIGREMKEAGKPMKTLGKKMDVLGKQIDAEARVAEKTMRALIRDALAQGLASPAPAA